MKVFNLLTGILAIVSLIGSLVYAFDGDMNRFFMMSAIAFGYVGAFLFTSNQMKK